jgi:hypothetical protein
VSLPLEQQWLPDLLWLTSDHKSTALVLVAGFTFICFYIIKIFFSIDPVQKLAGKIPKLRVPYSSNSLVIKLWKFIRVLLENFALVS